MSWLRQHWLPCAFVLLGAVALVGLVAMAVGAWRIDSEWPGLVAGGLLLGVMALALRR